MFPFTRAIQKVAGFQRKYRFLSALIWLASLALGAVPAVLIAEGAPAVLLVMAVVAACCALPLEYAMAVHDEALHARMADTAGPVWQVQVNGVAVGQLSDALVADITHMVDFDANLYVDYLAEVGRVGLCTLKHVFFVLPMVLFWGGLASYFLAPSGFVEAIGSLRELTPDVAPLTVSSMFWGLAVLALLTVGGVKFFGGSFGYVNRFHEERAFQLRQAVKCAAQGQVKLFREIDRAYLTPMDGAAWSQYH